MFPFKWRYPRGIFFAMSYLGYTRGNRSLYLAVNDPRQSPIEIDFAPPNVSAQRTQGGRITITQYPEGLSTGGCGLTQDHDIVVGVLDGDWYDASRVYASWARHQPWATTPGPGASQEPRARREVHAWMSLSIPDRPMAESAARIERLARRLPVRLGVHVYRWHQTQFDTNYPDYFPARRGFKQWVARVRKAGVLVMPYINARLWDINAPSWRAKKAERFAAGISGERLDPETLVPSLEEYGNGQKLAPMCVGTKFWRKTVTDICRRIVRELGCDGVYLDQVGAEKPELCLNSAHGHPLGGGSWWLDGYRQMVRDIRRAIGPEPYLTTEANWEGCAADYDALLIYHGFGPHQTVPMFPVVHGGLARAFGPGFRAADVTTDGGEPFARKMGEYVAFGGQPGWGDLTVLTDRGNAASLAFFIRLCRLREQLTELFATGRMLRPPRVAARPSGRACSAICTLWENAGGDAWTVLLINPTHKAVAATVTITEQSLPRAAPLRKTLKPFSVCAIPLEHFRK